MHAAEPAILTNAPAPYVTSRNIVYDSDTDSKETKHTKKVPRSASPKRTTQQEQFDPETESSSDEDFQKKPKRKQGTKKRSSKPKAVLAPPVCI